MSAVVRATVNGEAVEAAPGTRLLDFLQARGVDARRIAVERNREVLPRAAHQGAVITDGDIYEVVHLVGGG